MGGLGGKTRAPGALRPKALMCYICGREFGTASLEIHIPQCQKKWELVQVQLQPKDRRKCPEAPKMMAEMPDLGDLPIKARGSAMQQYNDEAFN